MASADLDEDPTAEADPNALQVDSAGVPSILSGYTSPLFRDDDHPDSWQTRQPQRWEERHAQLHRKVQRLFDEIDDSGDGKLSAEEVARKLVDDDELEEYMTLSGRSTRHVFEQIDADHDGSVTREEFAAIMNARGHTFTVEWLEEQVVWHAAQLKRDKMNCDLVWNEFGQLVPGETDYGHPVPAFLMLFELQEGPEGPGGDQYFLSNETVSLCQRMWHAKLSIDIRLSVDGGEIMVLVGIPNVIMQDEARSMPELRMRLAKTKGMTEYNQGFHESYAQFERHTLGDGGLVYKDRRLTQFAGFAYQTPWTSALRQQVIKHRMADFGVDLETRMHIPPLKAILVKLAKRHKKRDKMRSNSLKQLLTAAGAYRENCGEIMGDEVAMLAAQVLADPFFTCYPDEELWITPPTLIDGKLEGGIELAGAGPRLKRLQKKVCDEHLVANGLPLLGYDDIGEVLEQIQSYHAADGPGAGENFVGTLQMYIPLHDQEELRFLRKRWGSWGLMFAVFRHEKPNEGYGSLALMDPANEAKFVHAYGVPLGFLYQPIDEIRDYFVRARHHFVLPCVSLTMNAVASNVRSLAGLFGVVRVIAQHCTFRGWRSIRRRC